MQLLHLDYLNLFDWVWNTSARASVLIVFLLLVKYVLKNKIGARLHYLLWFVVIVSLLMPWTPQSSFSLYNLTNLEMQKTSTIIGGAKTSQPSASVDVGFSGVETGNRLESIATVQNTQHILPNTGETLKSIATSLFTHRLLFFIWIMGIVVFIAATVLVNRRFMQRIKGQSVVDTKLLMALKEAKNKLNIKTEVPLIQTTQITSPSLFGLFRPRLLIPVGILEEFNAVQLNHVFVHELLHLKRNDVLVNWLTRALLILHWFNPILWYAFYKLREDQEIACDAITLEHIGINDAKEYAYTLIKLVESNSQLSQITNLASLSGSNSQIMRRITMIRFFRKATLKWTLLAVTVVGALAFVSLTNAKADTSVIQEVALSQNPVISVNALEPIKLNQNLVEYARKNYQGDYNYSSENDIASSTYGWMLGGLDRALDKDGLGAKKKQAEAYLPAKPIFVKSYDSTYLNDYYIVPYIQGQKFVGASVVNPVIWLNGNVHMDDGVAFLPREKLLNIDASDAIKILKQEKGIEKLPIPQLIFNSMLNESSQLTSDFSPLPSYHESNQLTSYSILRPSWEFILADNTRIYVNQAGKVINDTNLVPWYEKYIAPKYNSQAVQIEPNKLMRDDGWSLTVSKVSPLSISDGGWSFMSYDESKAGKYYAVLLTLENVDGKDKVFIPKGKVLGVVGSSGKLYNAKDTSFDSRYIQEQRGLQLVAKKDGRTTIEPGIFKASMRPMLVDASEQKLTEIIYQDEEGNKFEIPIQIPESQL